MTVIRVAFLSGPRGVGKDYVARLLSSCPDTFHVKLSSLLKETVAAGVGMSIEELEQHKLEKRFGPNGDKSYVDLQIELFEHLAAMFDNVILGRFMARQLNVFKESPLGAALAVISDSGRQVEVEHVVQSVGPENCLLVRMYRDGCSFEGDIRNYINDIDGVTTMEVQNEGTSASALRIADEIDRWAVNSINGERGTDDGYVDRAMQARSLTRVKYLGH